MTFEETNKKLENIVKKLEDEKTSLDESIKLFSEGVELSRNCYKLLEDSKGRITEIKQEIGKMTETEFKGE